MTIVVARRIVLALMIAAASLLPPACVVVNVERTVDTTAAAGRPALVVSSIAQLRSGYRVPFEACTGDGCPKPTPKTRPSVARALGAAAPALVAREASPNAPELVSLATAEPAAFDTTLVSPRLLIITFESATATLRPAARDTLDRLAAEAKPDDVLEIRGRTDERGSIGMNDALARARAHAVRDYLRRQRLPAQTTIRVNFKGACCYVASNGHAQGRAANRRVEIEWTQGTRLSLGSAGHARLQEPSSALAHQRAAREAPSHR